jgi:hypothetical protein
MYICNITCPWIHRGNVINPGHYAGKIIAKETNDGTYKLTRVLEVGVQLTTSESYVPVHRTIQSIM